MQKFYFQSVTAEGKQISGYISAQSEEEAHQKLKDSKLSVLTLEKRDVSVHAEGISVFEFEAVNDQRKVVKGSIESVDMYSAYKKLKMNYKFDIKFIIPAGSSAEDKARLKELGVDPSFDTKLEIELKKEVKKAKKSKVTVVEDDEIEQVLKYREEEIGFMRDKIDSVLQEVIPLLEENVDYIDPIKQREIEERIDLLSRLKHSNSVDHLRNLTQKLLEELSSDQMFLNDTNLPVEMQEEIERRRQQFVGINEKFSKAIVSGLLDLQVKFAELSVDDIREKIASFGVLSKIRSFILSTFMALFVVCVLFWIVVAFQKFQGINIERVSFYFGSPIIWYFTSFAGLCSIWFFILGLPHVDSIKKQLIVLASGFVGLIIFLIQFPVIFYWTSL